MSSQPRANIPVHYSAEAYDRYTQAFLGRFDRLLADRLLQEFRANPSGRRLLDAGCGTCQFLSRLAGHAELSAVRFIGLDYFADMIQLSRGNVGAGIVLVQGDIHHLPFPPGSIDFVISRSTLHHWADPAAALLEIRRVLAPGGVALIHEIRRDPDPAALTMFNRLRAEAGVEPSRLEEKYTLDEIRQFIARSGLAGEAEIFAPSRGYSSLGCEVRITAPR
ncbi:MAG: class I SAM-dependent methyltransferase [Candidatus Solibacter sp.]|jgi:ubiquinone/menaquinone biosynthesis C-methylase UbiE